MDIQESINRIAMHIATEEDKHFIECLKEHISFHDYPLELSNTGISNRKRYICIDGKAVYEMNISSFGVVNGRHI